MSQENVEIVRRCLSFWAIRDYSFIEEIADPEVVLDLSRNALNPGVYRGYEGFLGLVKNVDDVWDKFNLEIEELIDGGASVVAGVRIAGKGAGSGVPVDMRLFQVWTLREGKVVRLTGVSRSGAKPSKRAGCRS